jgi:hypothetical protein
MSATIIIKGKKLLPVVCSFFVVGCSLLCYKQHKYAHIGIAIPQSFSPNIKKRNSVNIRDICVCLLAVLMTKLIWRVRLAQESGCVDARRPRLQSAAPRRTPRFTGAAESSLIPRDSAAAGWDEKLPPDLSNPRLRAGGECLQSKCER